MPGGVFLASCFIEDAVTGDMSYRFIAVVIFLLQLEIADLFRFEIFGLLIKNDANMKIHSDVFGDREDQDHC